MFHFIEFANIVTLRTKSRSHNSRNYNLEKLNYVRRFSLQIASAWNPLKCKFLCWHNWINSKPLRTPERVPNYLHKKVHCLKIELALLSVIKSTCMSSTFSTLPGSISLNLKSQAKSRGEMQDKPNQNWKQFLNRKTSEWKNMITATPAIYTLIKWRNWTLLQPNESNKLTYLFDMIY